MTLAMVWPRQRPSRTNPDPTEAVRRRQRKANIDLTEAVRRLNLAVDLLEREADRWRAKGQEGRGDSGAGGAQAPRRRPPQ